jgi:hypothetical protein
VTRLRASLLVPMLCAGVSLAAAQSVRDVDSLVVGRDGDEAAHHFTGTNAVTGTSGGRTWRSATGSFSYTLRIYDDSPLTIALVLADGDGVEAFDLLLDGRQTARITRGPGRVPGAEVQVKVPFKETEGKTSVVVTLRAHAAAKTARLCEIRTVQEHLEL